MNEEAKWLLTTDMNVTEISFDTTSNQGSNSFILNSNFFADTLLIGSKENGRPISGSPACYPRIALSGHCSGHVAEKVAHLAADAAHRGDRRDRNQRGDQGVFDRGRAALIAGQPAKNRKHRGSP